MIGVALLRLPFNHEVFDLYLERFKTVDTDPERIFTNNNLIAGITDFQNHTLALHALLVPDIELYDKVIKSMQKSIRYADVTSPAFLNIASSYGEIGYPVANLDGVPMTYEQLRRFELSCTNPRDIVALSPAGQWKETIHAMNVGLFEAIAQTVAPV